MRTRLTAAIVAASVAATAPAGAGQVTFYQDMMGGCIYLNVYDKGSNTTSGIYLSMNAKINEAITYQMGGCSAATLANLQICNIQGMSNLDHENIGAYNSYREYKSGLPAGFTMTRSVTDPKCGVSSVAVGWYAD